MGGHCARRFMLSDQAISSWLDGPRWRGRGTLPALIGAQNCLPVVCDGSFLLLKLLASLRPRALLAQKAELRAASCRMLQHIVNLHELTLWGFIAGSESSQIHDDR